jgi:hypothetical protein
MHPEKHKIRLIVISESRIQNPEVAEPSAQLYMSYDKLKGSKDSDKMSF